MIQINLLTTRETAQLQLERLIYDFHDVVTEPRVVWNGSNSTVPMLKRFWGLLGVVYPGATRCHDVPS